MGLEQGGCGDRDDRAAEALVRQEDGWDRWLWDSLHPTWHTMWLQLSPKSRSTKQQPTFSLWYKLGFHWE